MVNQSHAQELNYLEKHLYEGHPHTIIYNADQEVLSFPNPPATIGNLIVTNGNNQCTSIRDYFLYACTGLTSLDTQGLINVTLIEKGFLYGCHGLTSFDTQGLINVKSIGGNFLACSSFHAQAEELKKQILERSKNSRLSR